MHIQQLIKLVQNNLTNDLRTHPWRDSSNRLAGHCYVACEALYHLSGKSLKSCYVRHEGVSHWFLKTKDGLIVDPTAEQFSSPVNYKLGIGKGFLTKTPSKRSQIIINNINHKKTKCQKMKSNLASIKSNGQ